MTFPESTWIQWCFSFTVQRSKSHYQHWESECNVPDGENPTCSWAADHVQHRWSNKESFCLSWKWKGE